MEEYREEFDNCTKAAMSLRTSNIGWDSSKRHGLTTRRKILGKDTAHLGECEARSDGTGDNRSQ